MTDRVLVVDDDPGMVNLLRILLSLEGWEVLTATNGTQALEIAECYAPHLILLDIMMPGMDGYEVCRRLRADPRFREVPVLAFTALSESEDQGRARQAGFDDLVSKGMGHKLLIERMRSFLVQVHDRP